MDIPAEKVFALLVIFQLKHYIADFPLQREYMLKKAMPEWNFLLPLTLHCSVHSVITFAITAFINIKLWWLALVDFALHFTMDRIKSGPRYLGRFNDKARPGFWNALGFDQMFHHLTHYYIIYTLVTTGL